MSVRWHRIATPPFLAAATVLFLGVLGLNWVIASFEVFVAKQPIELRQPLFELPDRFGPYQQLSQEPDLTPEIEAVLGAHAYITREYMDTRKAKGDPGAVMRLHIAYFTGTPDMIIHVPEVCYIAHGAQGQKSELQTVRLDSPLFQDRPDGKVAATTAGGSPVTIPSREVPLRVFNFAQGNAGEPATVTYFFAANGSFMGTTTRVRTLVFDVRDKYAYWCKIETLPVGVADRQQAVETVREFLGAALPEIMACLPDWEEVKAGRYPVQPAIE